jgi:glycosyltransferase involved in cell wall biosynthesis
LNEILKLKKNNNHKILISTILLLIIKMKKKNHILFWSPFLGNIGTKNAVINSAEIINKKSENKIFLVNTFGELNDVNIKSLNILSFCNIYKFAPKTGLKSKFIIYTLCIILFPLLLYKIKKNKVDIIISNLVSFLPLITKFFFKKIKIIVSIQGYPKLTFLRKLIWNILYKKSYVIITMTDNTKKIIEKKTTLKNIVHINNPIITKKIKDLSKKKLNKIDEKFFKRPVAISIGRLTKQKNFIELIKNFDQANKILNYKYNLIILGDGEQRDLLKKYINENDIKQIYLLGFRKNPYNLLANSKLFICTSLWEDPGHAIIEAAYLKIPIITSNCPSGPKEIFKNNLNCLNFNYKNQKELKSKIFEYDLLKKKAKVKLINNAKNSIKKFSSQNYYKEISQFI